MPFHLVGGQIVGATEHRSGWPVVHAALSRRHRVGAIVLDDFTEATFTYAGDRLADLLHRHPWVGIFHHPVTVDSRIPFDHKAKLPRILAQNNLRMAARTLRKAICLAPDSADCLRCLYRRDVLVIKHPTEIPPASLHWSMERFAEQPVVFQCGHFLRDTQAIYQLPTDWPKLRVAPRVPWQKLRDRLLRRVPARDDPIANLEFMDADRYDSTLTRCVVFTRLMGAAANNTVVECIARNTPIVVNRLPAVEFYLGKDYPLLYDTLEEAGRLLCRERIAEAHAYLAEMNKDWLDVEQFANQVEEFCE